MKAISDVKSERFAQKAGRAGEIGSVPEADAQAASTPDRLVVEVPLDALNDAGRPSVLDFQQVLRRCRPN